MSFRRRTPSPPKAQIAKLAGEGRVVREVDPKRTRKALRMVRKLAAHGGIEGGAPETIDPDTGEVKPGEGVTDYTTWENEFLGEVGARLEKYGSAFHNLAKGRPEEALSVLQAAKLKQIAAKALGKPRKGLTTKKPLGWKKHKPRED